MHQSLLSFIAILILVIIVALVVIHQLVSTAGEKMDQVVDKVQGYIDDIVHPGIVPFTAINYPQVPDDALEAFSSDQGVVLCTATIQSAVNSYFDKDLFLPATLRLRGKINNYGLVLEHDNYVIVTFRGSADSKDFARDFQAFQETFYDINGLAYKGLCHVGFKNALSSFTDLLVQYLHGVNKPIIFTGHSLGGCLAILALMYMTPLLHEEKYLITFAAPRFGDYDFNEAFYKVSPKRRQIASMSDFIPQFPLSVFGGYYNYLFGQGVELIDFQTGGLITNHSLLGYRAVYEGTCQSNGKDIYTNMKWCLREL